MTWSRRWTVAAFALVAISAPAGFAVAQDAAEPADPQPGVPASACPEAEAAAEKHGESVDRFIPDCPTPEEVNRELAEEPGEHLGVPVEEIRETCEEAPPQVARGNGLCQELGAGQ